MKAITKKDICFSTVLGNSLFNTDGVERSTISIEEGRSAIDFEIHKKQSYHYDPVAGEIEAIPHHFHLVRDTDGTMLDAPSVGDQFVPVNHRDIYDFITKEIMTEFPDTKIEIVGTIHGLSTGVISLDFGGLFSIRGDESPSKMRMLYANPCNGTGRLVMGFHTVRIACQNTLVAAIRQASSSGWRIKHTKGAEIHSKEAVAQVCQAAKAAVEMKRRSEILASIGVDSDTMKRALEAIYPSKGLEEGSPMARRIENLREQVLHQFEGGATAQTFKEKNAWMLFNSFSYPVFNEPKITRKTDKAQVAYLGMVGNRGEEVLGMFNTIEKIVGAA